MALVSLFVHALLLCNEHQKSWVIVQQYKIQNKLTTRLFPVCISIGELNFYVTFLKDIFASMET